MSKLEKTKKASTFTDECLTFSQNSYFKALKSAYNLIFEADLLHQTVGCIYGKDTSDLGNLYDVKMTVDSAQSFWVNNYIVEEDRSHMRNYLKKICTPGYVKKANHPLQTEFRVTWDDDITYCFIGVAVELDENSILFCCRDTAKVQFSSFQAREILALRRLHNFLESYFSVNLKTKAAAVFELNDDESCNLIFASDSLLNFLGLRHDQYLRILEDGFKLPDAISRSEKHGVKEIKKLLKGEQIKFKSSPDAEPLTLSLKQPLINTYVFSATLSVIPSVSSIPGSGVFARTFGFFDIFVDGQPVVFSNAKEKELMALLIDRHGGSLTSKEAISYLWEVAGNADERIKARFRKLAMGLKRTLEKYGIEHILVSNKGTRHININAIKCDYYELLAGNAVYVQSFHNSYMSEYSWSEHTLAALWDYS